MKGSQGVPQTEKRSILLTLLVKERLSHLFHSDALPGVNAQARLTKGRGNQVGRVHLTGTTDFAWFFCFFFFLRSLKGK